jgi:hypothetical protein
MEQHSCFLFTLTKAYFVGFLRDRPATVPFYPFLARMYLPLMAGYRWLVKQKTILAAVEPTLYSRKSVSCSNAKQNINRANHYQQ